MVLLMHCIFLVGATVAEWSTGLTFNHSSSCLSGHNLIPAHGNLATRVIHCGPVPISTQL